MVQEDTTPKDGNDDDAVDGGTDQPVGNKGGANAPAGEPDPVAAGEPVDPADADANRGENDAADGGDDDDSNE